MKPEQVAHFDLRAGRKERLVVNSLLLRHAAAGGEFADSNVAKQNKGWFYYNSLTKVLFLL